MVALASKPGSLLPAGRIVVRRFPGGIEEVADAGLTPAATLYLDAGVEAALATLSDLLTPMKVHPGDRALREALVNAVSHRSYAPEHLGKPIVVDVYFDGVRISNPGGALARVGMANGDGPTGTYRRNFWLYHFLKLLGLCEGQGLGVRQLREPDSKCGFFPAEFSSSSGSFSVLLPVDPESKAGRKRKARHGHAFDRSLMSRPASSAEAPGSGQRERLAASDRDAQVVDLLRERGSATRQEIQDALGVSRALVQQVLARLRGRGRVVAEAESVRSPTQRYRLG